jgi:hypothetical protein
LVEMAGLYNVSDRAVSLLLNYYQQTLQGLNQTEQVNALEIQKIAFDRGFNWSAMFAAFAEIKLSESAHQALFSSWRNYIQRNSEPRHIWNRSETSKIADTWWVIWLIDSIVDSNKGTHWFGQKITQWIANLSGNDTPLEIDRDRLRLLTQDLTEIQNEGKSSYPQFYKVAICPQERSTPNDQSRQEYLKQYAPADLLEQMINYWKTNLQYFIPKPELAHQSNYNEHARWMAALKELSPDNYATLLAEWQVIHKRRSNLWKAMKAAGLG